jgi:anaerobic selenocysteine-containing dehydrogenase
VPERVVTGVCHHDCPDSCVWEVTVRDGAAVRLRGQADHPFTRGELCPKVHRFLDRVHHPDRILHPLVRTGPKGSASFERTTWDDALTRIAARWQQLIAEHGPATVLPFGYAGNQGILQCRTMSERLFNRLGVSNVVGGLCGNTAEAGLRATQGTGIGIDPEDLRHARVILLWSTNTLVTNRHLWPILQEARAEGARVICIDPLRTRTAAACDEHVQLLPGTDGALALGMMHVLVARDLVDHDYVAQHAVGYDELVARLQEWPPERAAEVCGLDPADIERLAVLYGEGEPSAIRVLIGMEHRENGAMAYRNIACLPILTGAWRHRGGGLVRSVDPLYEELLPIGALRRPDLRPHPRRPVEMGKLGEVLTELPDADAVRALVVYNCNPAAIVPNQAKVLAGLARDDLFTVVLEQFVTDTARYADVVLPVTTQIEHLDLMPAWGHLYLTLNLPAIEPLGEALPNTEVFRRLAAAIGVQEPALHTSDEDLLRELLAAATHPFMEGITYERLVAEGSVKVGRPDDWRPHAEGAFPTASGKAELTSVAMAERALDPLPTWVPAREGLHGDPALRARFPLSCLTSKRHQRFLNSSYQKLPAHTGPEGEPRLEISTADAAARGISEGDRVRVWNDRGAMELVATISDRVRPSLVSVPFGWPLEASGGVSCNTLTSDASTDFGGGAAFHDNLVEVAPV